MPTVTRPLDHSTTGPLSLDLSHLPPGIYFVSGLQRVTKLVLTR
jgi:hypothetical protein